VLPEISSLPILQLASGDYLSLQLYHFRGDRSGKKAYLQSNLHGCEISGNAVLHELINFLQSLDRSQLEGEVVIVPACNPMAMNARSHHFSSGRYNPYDGRDWNRIFWDYHKVGHDLDEVARDFCELEVETIRKEYLKLIKTTFNRHHGNLDSASGVPLHKRYRYLLQSLCLDANYVIDCHSSSNRTIDYFYCFHDREESAKYFLIDRGIFLESYDGYTFDEAFLKPWLALEKALAKQGRKIIFDLESWTLELGGGMEVNPQSVAKGVRGIKNYLVGKQMLTIPGFPLAETRQHQVQFFHKHQLRRYHAVAGGILRDRLPLGSIVKAGDRLYTLLSFNKNGKCPTEVEIEAERDGVIYDISVNESVNQSDYVLSIFEDNSFEDN
jgi:predicted deacylase